MSDEVKKTEEEGGAGKPVASHDDLKAKLGLKLPEKKPVQSTPEKTGQPEAPRPAPAKESAPRPAPVAVEMPVETETRGLSKGTLGAFVAVTAFLFIMGIFVGGVFKSRAVENSKTREAAHLLEYFSTAAIDAVNGGTIMETVNAHMEDTVRVFDMMNKAEKPEEIEKATAELEAYIKRCQKYRDVKAYFQVGQAFPGVVFNGEVGSQAFDFMDNVRRLYQETVIFALEADTRDMVTALEDKEGGKPEVFFFQPVDKENGEKWNKGTWIARVDYENPEKTASGTDYAMIPMDGGKPFKASTASLAEVDVAPLAKAKSMIHRKAIADRVRGRLAQIRLIIDEIKYEPLENRLKELSGRGEYVTFF